MKQKFISSLCLFSFLFILAPVVQAQDSTRKNHESHWEELSAQVVKAYRQGRYQEGIAFAEKAYQYALQHFGQTHP